MKDFLMAALKADIHKAMGASGLVPVKRMIRGKFGTYFAIRWVRPGEEQKGDIKVKNPTADQYKQADAEATPEKASKLIDKIEGSDPRALREGIAKMLQELGGGHDAHHAVLEAMEAKGIQFEKTGNILTTWENAIDPLMNYLDGRAADKTPEPEPEKQAEPKQEEPATEQKQELKGSEKQVKWATEIRDRMLDTFGKYRDYAKDKNPNEVAVVDSLIDAINKATNARTFIDLFQGFRPKGDLEQDVKSLYGYYGTAAKNASTADEKRLVQPLLDVWAKFSNEKGEVAPAPEKKPEPESNVKLRVGGVAFENDTLNIPGNSGVNMRLMPSKDEMFRKMAESLQHNYREDWENSTVRVINTDISLEDYMRRGTNCAHVFVEITGKNGNKIKRSTSFTLPPTGKDKETVTIRGQKYARRLFEEKCGRNDLKLYKEEESEVEPRTNRVRPKNYDAVPLTLNRDKYMKIPAHIRGQLTYQSLITPVATAIATGKGIVETPMMDSPHVIYAFDLIGGDAKGNLTVRAFCRGEDGFDKTGQYTIQLSESDLHIDSADDFAKTKQAQRLQDLESDLQNAYLTENGLYAQKKSYELELADLDKEAKGLDPKKDKARVSEINSRRRDLKALINQRQWSIENNHEHTIENLEADYQDLCERMGKKAKTFDKPLKGQIELTEDYVPPKPKKPKKESKPKEEKPEDEKKPAERKPKTPKYEDSPYADKEYWNSFDSFFPPVLDMKASKGVFDPNLAKRIRADIDEMVKLGRAKGDWQNAVNYYLDSWTKPQDWINENTPASDVERHLSTNINRDVATELSIRKLGYDRLANFIERMGYGMSDNDLGINAHGATTLDLEIAELTPNALIRIHDNMLRHAGLRKDRPAEEAHDTEWRREMEAEIEKNRKAREAQDAKIKEQYFHGKTEERGIQLKARAVRMVERSISADLPQAGITLNKLRLKRIEKLESNDSRKSVRVTMIADVTNKNGESFRYPIKLVSYVDEGNGDSGANAIVELKYKPSMSTETSREILDRFDRSGAAIGFYQASGAEAKAAHLYDMMAGTVSKIYPKLSDDEVAFVKSVVNMDYDTANVFKDPTASEPSHRYENLMWQHGVKTAQIIDQCSTEYDTVARDDMTFTDFARRIGLNGEQANMLLDGDLSFLRGISYKTAGFTTVKGVSTDYSFKDVEIKYLLPAGSKVAYTKPFFHHIGSNTVNYREGINWNGSRSVPYHEVKAFNNGSVFQRNSHNDLLIQKNSNFRIVDARERKGSTPDNRKLEVTIMLDGSHTWDDDPHGEPPKDWNPITTPKWW